MDFMDISVKYSKEGVCVWAEFLREDMTDLMIRGSDFYAIWNEETGLWETNENRAIQLIDKELDKYVDAHPELIGCKKLYLKRTSNGQLDRWLKFVKKQNRDSYKELDTKLTFADDITTKTDYVSKRLNYTLEPGDYSAWERLISTLYSPSERHKIEWLIGSIVAGESVNIQKFGVFYGSYGTGKSTILNLINKMFDGYCISFDAQSLGNSGQRFSLAQFKSNPLVAIQHDGDLSKIEDNTKLNSIVSHEVQPIEDKYQSVFNSAIRTMMLMGSNQPVKITDAKSGLLRRLIDISPTGEKIPNSEYKVLVKTAEHQLGAIAYHCKEVFEENQNYYDNYTPLTMMAQTNDVYDFMLFKYDYFDKENEVTLSNAYAMYKDYASMAGINRIKTRLQLQAELNEYFDNFDLRGYTKNGDRVHSLYSGFKRTKFEYMTQLPKRVEEKAAWLSMAQYSSAFDALCCGCYSQYATEDEKPLAKWDTVTTVLRDIDTHELHYVRVPENHIVIDFDIPDSSGNKSLSKNLQAASKFPPTYAELSKSGKGIHLHYIYKGDPGKLSRIFAPHIEVKVFTGKSSLRRKLTACNNLAIAEISSGLPLKGEDIKMVNDEIIKSEKVLRTMILRNLNKEYHKNTAPSVDFIKKLLDEAYASGIHYDVEDMKHDITVFAMSSTHQAQHCLEMVAKMKFKSDTISDNIIVDDTKPIVIFDIEVKPNMNLVCWKKLGKDASVNSMFNPSSDDISKLVHNSRLIGFNNRKYDNHILYAIMMGMSPEAVYDISNRIISGDRTAMFGEAYNLSYTDIYDYSSKKQSLKKWEIELDISHKEFDEPWNKPIDPERWEDLAEYCINDVIATECVWEATQDDFRAREILADLSEMTVNDTTNTLTARIVFGKNKSPQAAFNYRFLGDIADDDVFIDGYDEFTRFTKDGKPVFPGYSFNPTTKVGKSKYRDTEDIGEGGYVYAKPGMYGPTITLDISSMHPSTIIAEVLFGPEFTKNYSDLKAARIAIKHKDYEKLKTLLNGRLMKFIDINDAKSMKAVSTALKIPLNSAYGLTFQTVKDGYLNPFRDLRNVDNIVAKRGALFMINLRHLVEERGYNVIHIKTDSIKIENPTDDIIEFVKEYGRLYGYEFETEHVFEKICLVNNAVYIGKLAADDPEAPGEWEATGTQFAVPYVFKTLFSKEDILFKDMCETKQVANAMYLDMNEFLEKDEHDYRFVGKVGLFCPIVSGKNAGLLMKDNKGKMDAVTGTKGFRWLESETVKGYCEDDIDISFYNKLVDDAITELSKYGDISWFLEN